MSIYKDFYESIREEAKKTYKAVKRIETEAKGFLNPVDTDLVKTTKSMFYERTMEELRKVRKGGKE